MKSVNLNSAEAKEVPLATKSRNRKNFLPVICMIEIFSNPVAERQIGFCARFLEAKTAPSSNACRHSEAKP